MKLNGILVASMVALLMCSGCDKKQTPVDQAKDALNMREHEKMKDAAEDAKDAVDNAAQGVKDEMNDKD
jgi:hypothetical protein